MAGLGTLLVIGSIVLVPACTPVPTPPTPTPTVTPSATPTAMVAVAERWLTFAREDLQVAEVVLKEGIYNAACFHAQQCVEKAKGALAQRGLALLRIHSITDPLSLFPPEWLADLHIIPRRRGSRYRPGRCLHTLPGPGSATCPDSTAGPQRWGRKVAGTEVRMRTIYERRN